MAESSINTDKIISAMIRNATHPLPSQIEELMSKVWKGCHSDAVSSLWQGFPAGFRFVPSELELLEHLEGKIGLAEPHPMIDVFVPTIEEMQGICYTHPKDLPGMKMDGSARYFFHKISNAFSVGTRKRRKISNSDHTTWNDIPRWHKTGESKSILDNNGVIKGWQKIMVLRMGSTKGGARLKKTNWTMHQFHLGGDENEKDGEFVISKVFFSQTSSKKARKFQKNNINEEPHSCDAQTDIYSPHSSLLNNDLCDAEQNQVEAEVDYFSWFDKTLHVDNVGLPNLNEHLLGSATQDTHHENPQPLDYPGMDIIRGGPPEKPFLLDFAGMDALLQQPDMNELPFYNDIMDAREDTLLPGMDTLSDLPEMDYMAPGATTDWVRA